MTERSEHCVALFANALNCQPARRVVAREHTHGACSRPQTLVQVDKLSFCDGLVSQAHRGRAALLADHAWPRQGLSSTHLERCFGYSTYSMNVRSELDSDQTHLILIKLHPWRVATIMKSTHSWLGAVEKSFGLKSARPKGTLGIFAFKNVSQPTRAPASRIYN
jgi:hypothetical protein